MQFPLAMEKLQYLVKGEELYYFVLFSIHLGPLLKKLICIC